jgi:hypothetical protein
MFVALSFIGVLPEYIIDTIHQTRLFFFHDIYLIIDDVNSPHLKMLEKYNVKIIEYAEVKSIEFLECFQKNQDKFIFLYGLKERYALFMRSIERFFLLYYLMRNYGISDGFFMELDNLIYDDPHVWLSEFSKHELCYMFDNENRCASGIMYVKSFNSLVRLLNFTIEYINKYDNSEEWLNEMAILCCYKSYAQNFNDVQIIPTHWDNLQYPKSSEHYDKYNNTIFDAAGLGIFLFGNDPSAFNAPAVPGAKSKFSMIDYTVYKYDWITDKQGRKIPHIYNGNEWVKINNLHIYTKDLKKALSISY